MAKYFSTTKHYIYKEPKGLKFFTEKHNLKQRFRSFKCIFTKLNDSWAVPSSVDGKKENTQYKHKTNVSEAYLHAYPLWEKLSSLLGLHSCGFSSILMSFERHKSIQFAKCPTPN